MKKFLALALSLVLTASIIAGPIETFNIEVKKITKDLTEKRISASDAAGKIYDAREKLFVAGGRALRTSAGLKARIEQIKKESPAAFAEEWNAIEAMQKKDTADKRASHKKLEEIKKSSERIQKELIEAKLVKDAAAAEALKLEQEIAKLRAEGKLVEERMLATLVEAQKKEREARNELEKSLREIQEIARQAEIEKKALEEKKRLIPGHPPITPPVKPYAKPSPETVAETPAEKTERA